VKLSVPLEPTMALLNSWSYNWTGKGRVIVVTQSSQWLPVSVRDCMPTAGDVSRVIT